MITPKLAPTLMIQGTSSSVGKSLLTTGLCRAIRRRGWRVAPFKAQNMALNSYVTPEGGEIGRAQALQAEACGIEAHVDMNPVLLKPEADRSSQVVVLGQPLKGMSAREYHEMKPQLRQIIVDSLTRLRQQYDLVIIEGAGSPAEVNLKSQDIVNMFVAKSANSPVLLVGDIDRGGIFASLLGTLDLLEPDERDLVIGLVVNKFRGDPELFQNGITFLEEKSRKRVLGLVPFVKDLNLADEDSLGLESRPRMLSADSTLLNIAIIRYPRISNFDEFESLEHEPLVHVAYVDQVRELEHADLVILPGSKNTATDLLWMREKGIDQALMRRAHAKKPILGICGGCQMLGTTIEDPGQVESQVGSLPGLSLLPYHTVFEKEKITRQVRARIKSPIFSDGIKSQSELRDCQGYEIHMGRLIPNPDFAPSQHFAELWDHHADHSFGMEGYRSEKAPITATLVHGLVENAAFRFSLIEDLWRRRGQAVPKSSEVPNLRSQEFDRLADHMEKYLDMEWLIAKLARAT